MKFVLFALAVIFATFCGNTLAFAQGMEPPIDDVLSNLGSIDVLINVSLLATL